MDGLKQALAQFLPVKSRDIVSPVPAGQITEPNMRYEQASKTLEQAIAKIRKMRPNIGQTDEQLAALYAKYGDQIIPKSPSRPTQSVLGSAVKQMQGAAQAEAAAPQITATPTPQISPTPAPDASDFEKLALPILNKYNIPPSVAFGMRDAEGGKIGANNVFNINAVDSNPQAATNYATPQEGIEAFAKLIATDPRYKKAFDLRDNPQAMIQAIQQAGYAGDPSTWRQRSASTGGAGKVYKSYADFVKDTPGFARYSK